MTNVRRSPDDGGTIVRPSHSSRDTLRAHAGLTVRRRCRRGGGLRGVGGDEELDAAVRAFDDTLADELADAAAVGTLVAPHLASIFRVKGLCAPVDVAGE